MDVFKERTQPVLDIMEDHFVKHTAMHAAIEAITHVLNIGIVKTPEEAKAQLRLAVKAYPPIVDTVNGLTIKDITRRGDRILLVIIFHIIKSLKERVS